MIKAELVGCEDPPEDASVLVVVEPDFMEPSSAAGNQFVDLWLGSLAERTRETYVAAIAAFERSSGASVLDLLRGGHGPAHASVTAFKNAMLASGTAPATINVRLAALRSLARHARRLGLVSWMLDVEGVRTVPYRDTRGPGRSGFVQLLAATTATPRGQRDRAILWLLFGLGLRRAEVASLDLEHVDLDDPCVHVLGKGHRERVRVTLSAEARDALAAWLDARGPEPGPVFVGLSRARPGVHGQRLAGRDIHRLVAALGRFAGLGRVRPHGLRHAAITTALDAGASLRAVQAFSRHADPRTLMRYDDARRDLGGDVARLLGASVTASGAAACALGDLPSGTATSADDDGGRGLATDRRDGERGAGLTD